MMKKRILIVEDEAIIALNEKELLEELGYEVIGVIDSAEEAIQAVEVDCPDLILMDIKLNGEMDGIEATWKIVETHKIPIIFVTARGDKAGYNSTRGGKLSNYIIKPYSDEEMRLTLEAAFKGDLLTPGIN